MKRIPVLCLAPFLFMMVMLAGAPAHGDTAPAVAPVAADPQAEHAGTADRQTRLQVSAMLKSPCEDHEALSDAQAGMQTGVRISLAFFLSLISLLGGTLFYRARKDQMFHETLRLMVEKGIPIPQELLQPRTQPRSDLRRGLVLAAGGLGLGLFLALLPDLPARVWTLSLIPVFIGGAYMLVWRMERRGAGG